MPRAGPPDRQEAHEAARLTADRHGWRAAPRDDDARRSGERFDVDACERGRREQQQVAEQVIEPVAAAVDDHHPAARRVRRGSRARARGRSRPSRPGTGGRLYRPLRPPRRPRRRANRGRRPDGRRGRRARWQPRAPNRPRSRPRHPATVRAPRVPPRRLPAKTIAAGAVSPLMCPSLRRHYPEQVRGVGGGLRRVSRLPDAWPPSQPGSPELPVG